MDDFILFGTIVNAVATAVGSLIGLLIRFLVRRRAEKLSGGPENIDKPDALEGKEKAKPFSQRFSKAMMKGFALCTIYIGISGALLCTSVLVLLLSMVAGICIGELLNLDHLVNRAVRRLETRMKGHNIAEGLISAGLLFCVGAMTVNGALMSGLGQGHSILYSKSVLDFCAAIVYSMTMGVGVLLSSVLVFMIEGGIACLAALFGSFLSEYMITMMGAVGSLLIVALGLNLLGASKIKIINYIPAVFMPILFCLLIPA